MKKVLALIVLLAALLSSTAAQAAGVLSLGDAEFSPKAVLVHRAKTCQAAFSIGRQEAAPDEERQNRIVESGPYSPHLNAILLETGRTKAMRHLKAQSSRSVELPEGAASSEPLGGPSPAAASSIPSRQTTLHQHRVARK